MSCCSCFIIIADEVAAVARPARGPYPGLHTYCCGTGICESTQKRDKTRSVRRHLGIQNRNAMQQALSETKKPEAIVMTGKRKKKLPAGVPRRVPESPCCKQGGEGTGTASRPAAAAVAPSDGAAGTGHPVLVPSPVVLTPPWRAGSARNHR